MGLLNKISGGALVKNPAGDIQNGNWQGQLTPNQGFERFRLTPVPTQVREYNGEEAAALTELATEKAENAKHTETATKALISIDNSATKIQGSHSKLLEAVFKNDATQAKNYGNRQKVAIKSREAIAVTMSEIDQLARA